MTTTRTSTKTPKTPKTPKPDETATPAQVIDQALPMAPETLARTLRAVAAELERDPALARRVAAAVDQSAASSKPAKSGKNGKSGKVALVPDDDDVPVAKAAKMAKPRPFVPRLITGTSPDLGTGVPDPFALYRRLGPDGLRVALDELRLGTLRAIVREYTLDPVGRLTGQNDAERLRAAILDAAKDA